MLGGRVGRLATAVARNGVHYGVCVGCQHRTLFALVGDNRRESAICLRCRANARHRALLTTLTAVRPDWSTCDVYEAGRSGRATAVMATAARFTRSDYLPDVARGQTRDGVRSEDLERLTFPDEAFDVIVTQDVLEHVMDPWAAFAEIARVLRPGGVHIFTVPLDPGSVTRRRAHVEVGAVVYDMPAAYHLDPLDPRGVLVVTDWGSDLPAIVDRAGSTSTRIESVPDTSGYLDLDNPVRVVVSLRV